MQKARLQRQNSELELLDQQKTLYKTIESLWLDANSAQQQYAAATEKLRSTRAGYAEQNNLPNARQETLQAKYMAILNAQLLRFYQGEKIAL